jgi:fatty acid desaturase
MFQTRSVFTDDELLMLKRKSQWRAAWMIFHAWAVIFGAMALFVWWPTFIAATLIIGARQLGLAILSHDASHGLLFSNMKLNDFAGTWLTDYALFGDMYAYRPYHVAGHHRFTQQKNDPDIGLTAPFPITRSSMRRKFIRDLTGQTAYKQKAALIRRAFGSPDLPASQRLTMAWKRLHGVIVTNAIIFAILAVAGHWWLFFALWVFPYMTFHELVVRIRSIAEHSMAPDNDDPFRNTRTTRANWLMRALVAPYFVNYHLEHHLLMAVPCYNLPRAHEILLTRGYGPRMEIQPGYAAMLALATSKPELSQMRAAA